MCPQGHAFPTLSTLEHGFDSVPISVAHVSAIAVPMAPAPAAHQIVDGQTMLKIPKTAKAPPFAKTCNASRSPPFSTISPVSERFFDSPDFGQESRAEEECDQHPRPAPACGRARSRHKNGGYCPAQRQGSPRFCDENNRACEGNAADQARNRKRGFDASQTFTCGQIAISFSAAGKSR